MPVPVMAIRIGGSLDFFYDSSFLNGLLVVVSRLIGYWLFQIKSITYALPKNHIIITVPGATPLISSPLVGAYSFDLQYDKLSAYGSRMLPIF